MTFRAGTSIFGLVGLIFVLLCAMLSLARAADLHAIATIDPESSGVVDTAKGLELTLGLSNPVPYRVFTLSEPSRLVIDMKEVDWRGLPKSSFRSSTSISDVRYGLFQPGWSRMVLELSENLAIKTAEMVTSRKSPVLTVAMTSSNGIESAEQATSRNQADWLLTNTETAVPAKRGLRIVVDPGHGGVDPGAVRQGIQEKDIALNFSLELKEILEAMSDAEVLLTRDADFSVSLGDRVRFARDADADIFLSIHSNTVTRGDASGASVYTLSNRASDAASAQLAELENRADISVGFGNHVEADNVAKVLVDLSRVDTNARSKQFAGSLIAQLQQSVGVLRTKPHRSAGFKVLKAHDIPSVLLELGFMSNATDRRNMQDKAWRYEAAMSVTRAIEAWVEHDKERSKLVLK